jgi:hypothetical protein
MTYLVLGLLVSVAFNIILIWYLSNVLSKLLYTSDNLGDLFIALRMYEGFVTSLYNMDAYHGEPIIEELILKTKLLREEVQRFDQIYGLTTDTDSLEEVLANDDDREEEEAAQEN